MAAGAEALKITEKQTTKKKKGKRGFNLINGLQAGTVVFLLLYMEFAVDTGRVSKIFLASPSSIVDEFLKITGNGTLIPHLLTTLSEVLTGYLIAAFVGIVFGFVWTLFPRVEEYMSVFCAAIMAVPKVAILPLLILWFGIGFQSKVVLIFLFSVFQILYNTVTGAKQTREAYLKVARVFEASRLQTVLKVMIPAALPSMFNGLRLAAATATTGVVFAEMQAAKKGLGFLLSEAQNLLNTSRMFVIIILVTLISVTFTKLIAGIEYTLCHRWSRV